MVADSGPSRLTTAVPAFVIFLGAFLLFVLEPLIGRLLVPVFGSSIHIWLVTVTFFQASLFLGYAYAHLLAPKLGLLHLVPVAAAMILLPIGVDAPPTVSPRVVDILSLLTYCFGLPFLMLSTTAVVVQSWLTHSFRARDYDPYWLYGTSNAGSLMALLSYPFLIEPLTGLASQSGVWSIGYLIYFVTLCLVGFRLRPARTKTTTDGGKQEFDSASVSSPVLGLWLALSALPSGLMLAVTNYIGSEIGSFPMIWVLPLAIYLSSFVVAFRRRGGVPKWVSFCWPEALLVGLLFYATAISWSGVAVHLLVLLVACLLAHGELYERRPPASRLTTFYLVISLGGWIGGGLVSLVTPQVFSGLYDYPLGLCLLGALFLGLRGKRIAAFLKNAPILVGGPRFLLPLGLGLTAVFFFLAGDRSEYRHRNYYGTYRILEKRSTDGGRARVRQLYHGATLHGAQLLDPEPVPKPLFYYHPRGAIGELFSMTSSPRRIAVIGLGTGTIAMLASAGDTIVFYELDPDVERIAREWFTFLEDSRADTRVVIGDGRIALSASEESFDIVFVDAFTGDGVPTHLLTKEALETYLAHLNENGYLFFHISNRYYDLLPVLDRCARELGLHGARSMPRPPDERDVNQFDVQCVLLSRDRDALRPWVERGWVRLDEDPSIREATLWTDDYINVLEAIRAKLWSGRS